MPAISASAPGKAILFGEHSVVYGQPAIAVPIHAVRAKVIVQPNLTRANILISMPDQETELTFDPGSKGNGDLAGSVIQILQEELGHPLAPCIITVRSSIPISAGLGSSAALAVALFRGLAEFSGVKLTKERINALAYRSEQIQHGNPSGIDNTIINSEKAVYFQRGKRLEFLSCAQDIHLVLADSGERALTKDIVRSVSFAAEQEPETFQHFFSEMGAIARKARESFIIGDIGKLGELMTANHHLLVKVGVSSPMLDQLVTRALAAGASGAKLCGGGKGGFMVALCDDSSQEMITNKMKELSLQVISTTIRKDN